MKARYALALAGMLATSSSWACPACGDKLSVGGGMQFDDMDAKRVPGSLVVYAPQGSLLQSSNQAAALTAELEKAGHHVHVVTDAKGLAHSVDEHRDDIVVTHWSQASEVTALTAALANKPTVLPVSTTADDATAARAAGAPRCVVRTDGRALRKFPHSIDEILARRRDGLETACPVTLAQQVR